MHWRSKCIAEAFDNELGGRASHILKKRFLLLHSLTIRDSGVSNHLEFTLASGLRQLPVTSPCSTQALRILVPVLVLACAFSQTKEPEAGVLK